MGKKKKYEAGTFTSLEEIMSDLKPSKRKTMKKFHVSE